MRNELLLMRLVKAMGISSLVLLGGCGGKVFVDSTGGSSGSGGSGGSGGGSSTNNSTGTSPNCTGGFGMPETVCIDLGDKQCPDASADLVVDLAAKQLGLCADHGGSCCGQPAVESILCAAPSSGGECCYVADVVEDGVCVGRPLLVDGAARTAPLASRADWSGRTAPRLDALDEATRLALAEGWAGDARLEHASVAAFARLALDLLAAGAPAELVRGAQRAMGDEIRHAEVSFSLASAYAGSPLGPGPLALAGALVTTQLAELAAATVREGCVGETISAIYAAEARDLATDPAAREALALIAEDEAEHAALSWRIAAWAWRSGDAGVREAMREAFRAARTPGAGEGRAGIDERAFHAHGRLTAAEMRCIGERAMTEVVRPAFATLVGEA